MQLNLFQELQELTQVKPTIIENKKIVPRPYQAASVESAFERWEDGDSVTLVCLPTGTGKSVVFSDAMRQWSERHPTSRMMVLAHRTELIYQARQHAINAGLTSGIEMGGMLAKREAVIASSIQTQCAPSKCTDCRGDGCDFCDGIGKRRRMTRFRPDDFGLLVIDEAHHATANTYRMVMDYYRQNPNLKVLLVTATPKRADKIGLHNVCDSVAYEMQLEAAINDGWLVPIKPRVIHVKSLHLGAVKKAAGDLQAKGVEQAFLGGGDEKEEQELLHSVARPTIEQADGKPGIVFCAGKEHAEKLTAAFNAYDGVTAECLIDSTDKFERPKIIDRYKNGETQFLINCMICTEGFDAPATYVVANARPTKSESLLLQMIGRGTRPLKGTVDGPGKETAKARRQAIAASDKPHGVFIDFVGTLGKNTMLTSLDILAGDDCDPMDLAEALKVAKGEESEVDVEELVEKLKAARERREQEEEEKKRLEASKYKAVDIAYDVDEISLFLQQHWDSETHYTPTADGPSEYQCKALVALGFTPEAASGLSRRKASGIIGANFDKPRGEYVFTFGKHAGRKIKQLPLGYVEWCSENLSNGQVVKVCKAFLEGE